MCGGHSEPLATRSAALRDQRWSTRTLRASSRSSISGKRGWANAPPARRSRPGRGGETRSSLVCNRTTGVSAHLRPNTDQSRNQPAERKFL